MKIKIPYLLNKFVESVHVCVIQLWLLSLLADKKRLSMSQTKKVFRETLKKRSLMEQNVCVKEREREIVCVCVCV